jgi:hypothetical protein
MTPEQMRELVKECGLDWPRGFMPLFCNDPTNRFAVLIEAAMAAEREACAAICEQRSADHWHDLKDPASPFRGDPRPKAMADEAEQCAKAIKERGNQNG